MQGRFLSYSYLMSTLLIALCMMHSARQLKVIVGGGVIIGYALFYPHTPLNSSSNYTQYQITDGVSDERGYYFHASSIAKYIEARRNDGFFPAHNWALTGFQFAQSDKPLTMPLTIGYFGYMAGIEKIIIDPMALCDPLLARIPPRPNARIGHYKRDIPPGYTDSVLTGKDLIDDPQLREFYKKLKLVTQEEELFSFARLKTILLMNLGYYNNYLEHLWRVTKIRARATNIADKTPTPSRKTS